MTLTDEQFDFLDTLGREVASQVAREYSGHVTADDLRQDAWEWVFGHQRKTREFFSADESGQRRFFRYHIRNHLQKKARRERAAALGYEPEDQLHYSVQQIKDCLRDVWDHDRWTLASRPEIEGGGRTDPAEGKGRETALLDVSVALSGLTEHQRLLLELYFRDDRTLEEISDATELPVSTVQYRIGRAIATIRRKLGGPPMFDDPPDWESSRRPTTAQAVADAEDNA